MTHSQVIFLLKMVTFKFSNLLIQWDPYAIEKPTPRIRVVKAAEAEADAVAGQNIFPRGGVHFFFHLFSHVCLLFFFFQIVIFLMYIFSTIFLFIVQGTWIPHRFP